MKSSGPISNTKDVEFAHFIAPVIRKKGYMSTGEVKRFIEEFYDLTDDDKELIPSGFPRWEQVVRNMKSNKVFYRFPELGVVHANRGFKESK